MLNGRNSRIRGGEIEVGEIASEQEEDKYRE